MGPIANPHSPEELASLSTLAHNVIGWLLLVVAAALLWEILRKPTESRWRLLWPGIGMVIGLGLTAFVLLHFIFYHRVSPFLDPAQNQHQILGALAGLGATAEFVRRLRRSASRWWQAAWPTALVAVGVAFLIHEQGTTEALLVHWALAGTFILAGLGMLSVIAAGEEGRSLRAFSVFILVTAAVQLIVFSEKPGAHGSHDPPAPQPTSSHAEH